MRRARRRRRRRRRCASMARARARRRATLLHAHPIASRDMSAQFATQSFARYVRARRERAAPHSARAERRWMDDERYLSRDRKIRMRMRGVAARARRGARLSPHSARRRWVRGKCVRWMRARARGRGRRARWG
jgi:hypothetical protein